MPQIARCRQRTHLACNLRSVACVEWAQLANMTVRDCSMQLVHTILRHSLINFLKNRYGQTKSRPAWCRGSVLRRYIKCILRNDETR